LLRAKQIAAIGQLQDPDRSVEERTITGLVLDDQLWLDSMVIGNRNQVPPPEGWSRLDTRMRDLIHHGVYDLEVESTPWASSTRSMWFSSILVDQLYTIVKEERHRVRRGLGSFLLITADLLIQSNRLETQLYELREMQQE
jgi:hypothetical protein